MTDHDHTLQTGIDAVRRGDKSTARAAFRRVLRKDPDNIQALLWLAGIAGTRDEKDRVLQQVLRLDPDNKMAQEGLQALNDDTNTNEPTPPTPTPRPRRSGANDARPNRNIADQTDPTPNPADRDLVVLGATSGGSSGGGGTKKRSSRRRASLFWLIGMPLLLLAVVGGLYLWQQQNAPDTVADASLPPAATTDTAVADLGLASPSASGTSTDLAAGASASASTFAESGAAITGTNTINIPGLALGSASASPGTSEAPEPSLGAGGASAYPGPSGTPVPTIVAVVPSDSPAPSSTPEPSVVAAVPPSGSPSPDSSAAPSDAPAAAASASPTSSAAPSVVPTPVTVPSPAPTDVPPPTPSSVAAASAPPAQSGARPTLLPARQFLTDGAWRWSYYGVSNVTDGANYSVEPTGRYLIVLALVQNTGTTAAQIPDGLYVVTDEQGRTATFNRQASADYFQRYANISAADYSADAAIPPSDTPVTVPLLFDVPRDATNLIMTGANNAQQGFFVAQRMQ